MVEEETRYYKRIADSILQDRLRTAGAVLIKGIKWKNMDKC